MQGYEAIVGALASLDGSFQHSSFTGEDITCIYANRKRKSLVVDTSNPATTTAFPGILTDDNTKDKVVKSAAINTVSRDSLRTSEGVIDEFVNPTAHNHSNDIPTASIAVGNDNMLPTNNEREFGKLSTNTLAAPLLTDSISSTHKEDIDSKLLPDMIATLPMDSTLIYKEDRDSKLSMDMTLPSVDEEVEDDDEDSWMDDVQSTTNSKRFSAFSNNSISKQSMRSNSLVSEAGSNRRSSSIRNRTSVVSNVSLQRRVSTMNNDPDTMYHKHGSSGSIKRTSIMSMGSSTSSHKPRESIYGSVIGKGGKDNIASMNKDTDSRSNSRVRLDFNSLSSLTPFSAAALCVSVDDIEMEAIEQKISTAIKTIRLVFDSNNNSQNNDDAEESESNSNWKLLKGLLNILVASLSFGAVENRMYMVLNNKYDTISSCIKLSGILTTIRARNVIEILFNMALIPLDEKLRKASWQNNRLLLMENADSNNFVLTNPDACKIVIQCISNLEFTDLQINMLKRFQQIINNGGAIVCEVLANTGVVQALLDEFNSVLLDRSHPLCQSVLFLVSSIGQHKMSPRDIYSFMKLVINGNNADCLEALVRMAQHVSNTCTKQLINSTTMLTVYYIHQLTHYCYVSLYVVSVSKLHSVPCR